MKTVQAPTLEGFFESSQFEIYGIAMAAILVLVIVNYAIDAFMKH
jgi:hypothetical protein